MGIRERLATWRAAQGWTLAATSRALGVTPRTIRDWESGRTYPQAAQIRRIEELIGEPLTPHGTIGTVRPMPVLEMTRSSRDKTPLGATKAIHMVMLESDVAWLDSLADAHRTSRAEALRAVIRYVRETMESG